MEFNNCTNTTNISFSAEEYLQSIQDKSTITMIPAVVMLCIFSATGLIGNSMILFVYSQKVKVDPTKILLMTIAIFDLVANVGAIPTEISTMFHYWNFSKPGLCKFKVFFNVLTIVGGAVTLLALAVARYRKVCHHNGWQITKRSAKIISGFMAVLGFLFSIPYIILYGRMSKPTACYKIRGYECYTDDYYKGTIWPLLNNGLFVTLYLSLAVPLIVLYSLIGVRVRKQSNKMHEVYRKRYQNKNSNFSASQISSQSTELINTSEFTNSQAHTQSFVNPEIHHITCDNEYLENITGNNSGCESSMITKISSIKPSLENIKTVDDLEHSNPDVQKPDVDKTGSRLFFKNAQNMAVSRSRTNKSQICCKKCDENKKEGCAAKQQHETCGSSNEMKDTHFTDTKDNVLFWTENNSNSTNYTMNQKMENKMRIDSKDHQNTSGAKSNLSKSVNVQGKQEKGRSMRRTTVMLVIISAIYVIGYLSFLLLTLYKNIFPKSYAGLNMIEQSFYHLFLRLYYLNSAANPVIYIFCDPDFRRECLRFLRCRNKRVV